jgi:hypothetical protein
VTSVVLVTFGRPVEGRLLLTGAIWNRQRNPAGRREQPNGVLLSGLVPASVGAMMGSTHHRTRLRQAGCLSQEGRAAGSRQCGVAQRLRLWLRLVS